MHPARHIVLSALLCLLLGSPAVRAEFIIFSSANSRVDALSHEQAEQLYLGRRSALPDGTPANLVDLPAGPLRDRFYLLLTGKNPGQIRAWWSRQVFSGRALPPREASSLEEMRRWVKGDPGALGYLPSGEATEGLKVLLRLP